jgi:hypothetical protein
VKILAKGVLVALLYVSRLAAAPDEVMCHQWPTVPLLIEKDLRSSIVEELACDEKVVVLRYEGNWARVRTRNKRQGYLMRKFLLSQFIDQMNGQFKPESVVVLDEIETMVRLSQKVKPLENLRRRAPKDATFVRRGLGYSLDVVPDAVSDIRRRLEGMENRGMFGCAATKVREIPYNCRYIATIDFDTSSSPSFTLPANWATTLKGEEPELIWVLCFGTMDAEGAPLPDVAHYVVPVVVQTHSRFYVVMDEHLIQATPLSAWMHFQQPILSLPGCKQRSSCVNRVEKIFLDQVQVSFASTPLLASADENRPSSHSLRISRRYEKSLVLGAPYYEFSVYMLGLGQTSRDIYSDIDLVVLVSPNVAGTYVEATDQQLVEYTKAVRSSLSTALRSACMRVRGVMREDICIVDSLAF